MATRNLQIALTHRPVNKTASLIINQCGCSNVYELNGIKEERDQLRKNLTILMRKSNGGRLSKADKRIITEGNKRLQKLNLILKPLDKYIKQNRCKTYEEAIQKVLCKVYGREVMERLHQMAMEYL